MIAPRTPPKIVASICEEVSLALVVIPDPDPVGVDAEE